MKTVNKICQILSIVLGAAALVLFFTNFATIISGGNEVSAGVSLERSADNFNIITCAVTNLYAVLFNAESSYLVISKGNRL